MVTPMKTTNFSKLTLDDIIVSAKNRWMSFKGAIVWYFRSLQKPGWMRIYNLGEIVSLFSMSPRTLKRIIKSLREGNEFAIATAGVGLIRVTRLSETTDNSDIDTERSLTSPPPESKLSSSKKVLPTPSRLQSESREESPQIEKTGSVDVNPSQSSQVFVNRGLTRDDAILTSPSENVNTQPDSLTEDVESSESDGDSDVLDFAGDSTDIDQVVDYISTEVGKHNPNAKPACLVNVSGEDKISSNGFFIPVTEVLANPKQCVETILQSFSPPPSSLLDVLRELKQRNLEKFGPRINWNRKR